MRLTLIFLTVLALLISCNSTDTTKVASETTTAPLHNDSTENKTERQLLIEELNRLKATIASNDKERIAGIFQFPLSDTTVGIFIDDSTYTAQFEKNGSKTTKAMFIRFFPQISESLQIEELNQLFKNIKLENLQQKDTLGREVHIKTEPCYKFYNIEVQGDIITLTTGQGVNENFKSSPAPEDDIPENSSEFCEHVLWWVFKFDGKKLHFVKQHGAG